jgi:hypothetical protein
MALTEPESLIKNIFRHDERERAWETLVLD